MIAYYVNKWPQNSHLPQTKFTGTNQKSHKIRYIKKFSSLPFYTLSSFESLPLPTQKLSQPTWL